MRFTLTTASATVTIITVALMAGVFFAFTTAIIPGLNAINPAHAASAMNSINKKIQNPAFLFAFMIAPVAAATTGILLLTDGRKLPGLLFLATAVLYFLGAIMVTGAINLPMNDALAKGTTSWADFVPRWTLWTNIRGISSTLALVTAALGVYTWASNK